MYKESPFSPFGPGNPARPENPWCYINREKKKRKQNHLRNKYNDLHFHCLAFSLLSLNEFLSINPILGGD